MGRGRLPSIKLLVDLVRFDNPQVGRSAHIGRRGDAEQPPDAEGRLGTRKTRCIFDESQSRPGIALDL